MRFHARVSRTVLVWSWAIIAIIALSGLPRSALAQSAASHHSVVRRWNELLLASIRNDMARPVVHARNLFHMSAAMWDAWAVWDEVRIEDGGPKPWLVKENDLSALPWSADGDREEARRASISYAAYGILRWRFADSPGIDDVSPLYDDLMEELGYPVDYASMVGSDPRAIGNQIAAAYIEFGLSDGSNEKEAYANRWYAPTNIPLLPFRSGTQGIENPDRWQPLSLQVFVDQSGNSRATGYPDFLGPSGAMSPRSLCGRTRKRFIMMMPATNFQSILIQVRRQCSIRPMDSNPLQRSSLNSSRVSSRSFTGQTTSMLLTVY